ncbi:MAG: tetratricopeptide repeat protein [Planctomycetia bacterium]|nr:tetratricopeptide repeat protein [Planctomycetia bacterium]
MRGATPLAAALFVGSLTTIGAADLLRGADLPVPPGYRQADRHNPFSPRYADMRPGGSVRQHFDNHHDGHHHHHNHVIIGGSFSLGYPGYYGYWPYYGYRQPLYLDDFGYYGYGYYRPGPLFVPADEIFGLKPVLRMMGVDQFRRPAAIPNVVRVEIDDPKPKVRVANAQAVERAEKFVEFGDAHFAKQAFRSALERYKQAIAAAPDMVAAQMRYAQALVAVRQYEQGLKAFRRAMDIGPAAEWGRFRLAEIYKDNVAAKAVHLDGLAAALAEKPDNADLTLLLGLQLHFDGQADRAKPFLERYAKLSGQKPPLLDAPDDPKPLPPRGDDAPVPMPPAEREARNNGRADF